MSADYLTRPVYDDIEAEARSGADAEPIVLPTPDELGCTERRRFCQNACYCARLAKVARR